MSSLKDTNISSWWKEIKSIGGLIQGHEWWHQMLSNETPSTEVLARKFNDFLYSLTSHFKPLSGNTYPLDASSNHVPEHLLVTDHMAYKALCAINKKESTGPDRVPNVIWKTLAFELAPVIRDLYNTSLAEGFVPTFYCYSNPKSGSPPPPKTIQEDLRPIALTRQLAKDLGGGYVRLANERGRALD